MTAGLGGQTEIEHYHRYSFARDLAAGMDVVDVASGEGYGAAMLASVAHSVTGIEREADSVAHATEAYARPNLRFLQGDALAMPVDGSSADVVVSFETLEHFADHDGFLHQVRRVLRPGGIFVVSTPDRIVYSARREAINSFHVRELTRDEFADLLGRHFVHHRLLSQRVIIGSILTGSSDQVSWRTFDRRGPFIEASNGLARAHYLIGIASDSALPAIPPSSYVHSSEVDAELRAAERTLELEQAHKRFKEEAGIRDAVQREAEAARDAAVAALAIAKNELTRLLAVAHEAETRRQVADDAANRYAAQLHETARAIAAEGAAQKDALRALENKFVELQADRAHVFARLSEIETSEAWRFTAPLRSLGARMPRISHFVYRALQLGWWTMTGQLRARLAMPRLAAAQRGLPSSPDAVSLTARPKFSSVTVPEKLPPTPPFREEAVDIIICVHNALPDVRRCLASVSAHTLPPYRLILVDDGSAEETRDFLAEYAQAHAAMLIRHDIARGYTLAANGGLQASQAPLILLLNSDTEVTAGWLDRMADHIRRNHRVGLVGPLSNVASWQSVPQVMDGDDWAQNQLPPGVTLDDMARIVACDASRRGVGIGFLNGFCILMRRQVLDQIGLLDEVNFGDGYGEENDFCIRARKAGWHLMVAEDVYILHHQSKSYGHARRLELARRADQILAKKHNLSRDIVPEVIRARDSLLLEHARARVNMGIIRMRLIEEGRQAFEGKRIGIILPILTAGGGGNVVLQEAEAVRTFGVDTWIINVTEHREHFQADYPELDLPMLFGPTQQMPEFIRQAVSELSLDAVLATANRSFNWLPAEDGRVRLGYYVQDLETLFFEPGSPEYQTAFDTYTQRSEVRRVTKTMWNARAIRALSKIESHVIGPSVDVRRYAPGSDRGLDPARPISITGMVRPSTPRRNPNFVLGLLRSIKDQFGNRVDIACFGATDTEIATIPVSPEGIRVLGHLRSAQVAAVLAETDIFLDLSIWQAMGLTSLEAMASGAAVVVPASGGGSEIVSDGISGLIVDTNDAQTCLAAAKRLIEDAELRLKLRIGALRATTAFLPEAAALRMLKVVFAP